MLMQERIREILERSQTIERLAAIEHERWAHWQRYLHGQCERREDGALIIPADLADRWARQVKTPYSQLSEQEKESDKEQVHKYLPTVMDVLGQL